MLGIVEGDCGEQKVLGGTGLQLVADAVDVGAGAAKEVKGSAVSPSQRRESVIAVDDDLVLRGDCLRPCCQSSREGVSGGLGHDMYFFFRVLGIRCSELLYS